MKCLSHNSALVVLRIVDMFKEKLDASLTMVIYGTTRLQEQLWPVQTMSGLLLVALTLILVDARGCLLMKSLFHNCALAVLKIVDILH